MKITDETHSVTVVFSPVSVIFTPVVHPVGRPKASRSAGPRVSDGTEGVSERRVS